MPHPTAFTQLNGLVAGADGVFHQQVVNHFNYSDGEQAEQRLYEILNSSSDVTSSSSELEKQIVDWPTEYHLSSTRANLLRPLNLDGVTKVLELGCGCGSISRYLGEQIGLQVDSVEGSSIRASLAVLRCRDLANVTISTGNFNELQFPQNHYDLVVLVGVAEYAGRFSKCATDQEALQELLALAKRSITTNGAVMIAIENRTGLKYMMGASEDHYGVPYVGIDGYPESTGIRTYTKAEWQMQISQAGFAASNFTYTFPDYKVPSLLVNQCLLSEKLVSVGHGRSDDRIIHAVAKIKSRDYLAPFDLGIQEARLWQSVHEAGRLADFANSFMILLGDNDDRLQAIAEFDLVEYELPKPLKQLGTKSGSGSEANSAAINPAVVSQNEQSPGWKLLNRVGALFGRSTIVK